MANEDAELYISEFNTNVKLLAMQSKDRFAPWVMTGSHKGKQASPVDQIAATDVQQRTARAQPKILTDIANERRWVQPKSFHVHTVFDDFDKIRMQVDLNSPFLKTQMNAMNRKKEDAMIDAFFATSVVGEEGDSTISFSSDGGSTVTVGTTDLTFEKLVAAQKLLYEAEVDLDDPEEAIICAITPHQHETLLSQEEITNADFVRGKTLFDKEGRLTLWFGIHFIMTNRLLDTAGVRATVNPGAATVREIPMWAKSGMHSGIWDDVRGVIVNRKDLVGDPPEMSVYATFGATRLQGAKVVKIICKET
jgi:hypothetical protein